MQAQSPERSFSASSSSLNLPVAWNVPTGAFSLSAAWSEAKKAARPVFLGGSGSGRGEGARAGSGGGGARGAAAAAPPR